jgi:hypothetical protein
MYLTTYELDKAPNHHQNVDKKVEDHHEERSIVERINREGESEGVGEGGRDNR